MTVDLQSWRRLEFNIFKPLQASKESEIIRTGLNKEDERGFQVSRRE